MSARDGDEMAIDAVGEADHTDKGATRRRISDPNERANFPAGQPASLPLRSQWLGSCDFAGDVSVLVSVVAGADAVIAVRDLQGHTCGDVAAHEQDRRKSFVLHDFREIGFDVRVINRQQPQAGGTQDVFGFLVQDRRDLSWATSFSTAAWSAIGAR